MFARDAFSAQDDCVIERRAAFRFLLPVWQYPNRTVKKKAAAWVALEGEKPPSRLSAPACLALGAASLAEKRCFHLKIAWFFLPAAYLPDLSGRSMYLTGLACLTYVDTPGQAGKKTNAAGFVGPEFYRGKSTHTNDAPTRCVVRALPGRGRLASI